MSAISRLGRDTGDYADGLPFELVLLRRLAFLLDLRRGIDSWSSGLSTAVINPVATRV